MIGEKHSLGLKLKKKNASKNIKIPSSSQISEETNQYYSRPPKLIKPSKPSIILKIWLEYIMISLEIIISKKKGAVCPTF